MNRDDMLAQIATQIKADPQELIAYANEDQIGGFHIDQAQRKWPIGSLYGVEGETLYALIRWLKPDSVVQIGGWAGASATHLAMAVKANGKGHVTSVDNGGDGNATQGELLPDDLKKWVTLVWEDGEKWLEKQPDGSIGLLFEDASHASELVYQISVLALKKCEPGGLYLNHDAAHDFAIIGGGQIISSDVGRNIRDGLARANAYFRVYRSEPSDCGLSLTVIPGKRGQGITDAYTQTYEQAGIGNSNIESASTPPEPTTLIDGIRYTDNDLRGLGMTENIKPPPVEKTATKRNSRTAKK